MEQPAVGQSWLMEDVTWPFVLVHVSFEIYILYKHCPAKVSLQDKRLFKDGQGASSLSAILPTQTNMNKKPTSESDWGTFMDGNGSDVSSSQKPLLHVPNITTQLFFTWFEVGVNNWNNEKQGSESQGHNQLAVRWDIL